MVERELTDGAALEDAERDRALALLGRTAEATDDPRRLEREIAAGIRDGSLDDRLDAVRAHVRATVREKLLVANPGYLPDEPSA